MLLKKIPVKNPEGLYARPGNFFITLAGKFDSDIQVCNLTFDGQFFGAKSILSVLALGVIQNHKIEISISGVNQEEAINKIECLIQTNFAD